MTRSLVLITVDCLRSDHVGFLGYPRGTTPFLDTVAKQSLVFSNAFVAGAPTYYSLPAILASRYPLALGRDVVGLAPGEANLASVLHSAGYATAAFNAGNPYLSARFGYSEGFEVFRDFLDSQSPIGAHNASRPSGVLARWNKRIQRLSKRVGLDSLYDDLYFQYAQRLRSRRSNSFDELRRFPAADVLVNEAADWLQSVGNRPFFLWLHFMDPHAPYYPAPEALALMRDNVSPDRARYVNEFWNRRELPASRLRRYRETIVRLYDAGIRWVDAQVSRLIETLQALGKWDDCQMAFTADHGEEFLEHGSRFHPQWTAKEELVRVPLLIRSPDISVGQIRNEVFSHIDLAPTLLAAMGQAPPSAWQGKSRSPDSHSDPGSSGTAVIECTESINPSRADDRLRARVLCLREKRYKWIVKFRSGEEELYDLENDPLERQPIPLGENRLLRKRFLEKAQQHLSQTVPETFADYRLNGKLRNFRAEQHASPA